MVGDMAGIWNLISSCATAVVRRAIQKTYQFLLDSDRNRPQLTSLGSGTSDGSLDGQLGSGSKDVHRDEGRNCVGETTTMKR
jgi:hypothetical protein